MDKVYIFNVIELNNFLNKIRYVHPCVYEWYRLVITMVKMILTEDIPKLCTIEYYKDSLLCIKLVDQGTNSDCIFNFHAGDIILKREPIYEKR